MSISVDWAGKIVLSDASITDLPAFKDAVRALEESATGILYPPILTHKRVALGSGGYFVACDFINGYVLQFVGAGPFTITGNLNCTIVDTNVQVEITKASAFATTAVEGGGGEAADPWDSLVEGGLTARQAMRLLLAAAVGRTAGLNSANPRFKNIAGDRNRITATLDEAGDRSSVTLDPA